jgi:hypothetical protein
LVEQSSNAAKKNGPGIPGPLFCAAIAAAAKDAQASARRGAYQKESAPVFRGRFCILLMADR